MVENGDYLLAHGFGAVYFSLSVGVKQTHHPITLIYVYYLVGNVSDCGDSAGRNSAFDGRFGCL